MAYPTARKILLADVSRRTQCSIRVFICIVASYLFLSGNPTFSQTPSLKDYNITWNSQSKNSEASMPCGGGDIGLNVWVENGDVLFYISRTGSFDENNALLKAGRARIKLTPNPFEGNRFSQQ